VTVDASAVSYTVVIPTIGRRSLSPLLTAVAAAANAGPPPGEVVVVDDRRDSAGELDLPASPVPIRVLRSGGRGPAAARNVGWRATRTDWVAFLDDDVLVAEDWCRRLADDLAGLPPAVAASQGRIRVPMPKGRRPTDEERRTTGLVDARWITADMAYRRSALELVDGFDERFPRAFREDSDLALRTVQAGLDIVWGHRVTTHPLRPGPWTGSIRAQQGNADNALLRAKFGPDWRALVGEGPGRLGRHLLTTAAAAASVGALGARRRGWGSGFAAIWAALTLQHAASRILSGPRTAREVTAMLATSAIIPPAALYHRLRGTWRFRGVPRVAPAAMPSADGGRPPRAVLFDRDGTLIANVPYLADASRVQPVPGAREALADLRAADIRVGVVTNQSGVAKGLISPHQLAEVNARVDELLGPFDSWQVCLHDAADGCGCRKPLPQMVLDSARDLGVDAGDCVLIGDTPTDAEAALAAGARAVLVTPVGEVGATAGSQRPPTVPLAADLAEAVALAVGRSR
jgi:histidinol-phosphate phosphatase family protein